MAEEQRARGESAASSVKAAAKTGKAIADIAKGAATGGAHGAALAAVKHSKKWIGVLVGILLLPILLIVMLPVVIFGSLFGLGTDEPNAITDDTVLTQNMVDLNTGLSTILSEGLTDVLDRIDSDFAASGCDEKEVNNPYGADIVFNANSFVAMYCASKDTDVESISQADLESILRTHLDKLYSFTYQDESREVEGDQDPKTGKATTKTITVRVYTITYNGEGYFADEVFQLSDDQKELSNNYAQNLSVFLGDGSYQVLSSTEFSAMGLSYDGVVFTDGETQVVYYNQLDERWKDLPYGTDNIGGYACGPTSMSIVVSSLTSETIDPPHMAQWAYPMVSWLWLKRPEAMELCQGGRFRIRTTNTDPFNYGEVELSPNGRLTITMLQAIPLKDAAEMESEAKDDLAQEDLLERMDVKAWYTSQGEDALCQMIDDLNTQGHKHLLIKEDGNVVIEIEGKEETIELLKDFPPRMMWDDFCQLLKEDEITASIQAEGLALTW